MSGGPDKPRSSKPLLQVEKLSVLYPVRQGFFRAPKFLHAVDSVSFYIRPGETLGLVGESGCGKSTLGRTVLRLVDPTLGRIVFDGQDITRLSERAIRPLRRRMQIVFQDPYSSLNPRMTVREIVGEGIAALRLAKTTREANETVEEMVAKVGLGPEALDRYPNEFSGGQRQRIAIARALAVRPDFVVCDEPTSALDVSVQAQILNLLERLQDELSVSYLFISHDLRVVGYMSHRIAVMYLGRIVEMGPAREVAERRLHPYTRALFGALPREDGDPRPRRVLWGEPPGPLEPPRGCVFQSRCQKAENGRCDVEAPDLTEIVPGSHHRVACFHPEASELLAPRPSARPSIPASPPSEG
ncbi:ABC transporter ATP-binding protein [Polyangium mundeleinium]|uniref:ATP-binding cassette domain-containing protein n=1 Tax=Polyangium mundeleinium TaxID=2995306 RepID=A0ABT5F3G6_9BACT|nr:oligopeptide/dipeptide ABC transporter ATP-binding protein [Polyangium mundeleinium]MDC0748154.1 ATP-binding cassette domain-containing protein [Polyangium mundeleinium]